MRRVSRCAFLICLHFSHPASSVSLFPLVRSWCCFFLPNQQPTELFGRLATEHPLGQGRRSSFCLRAPRVVCFASLLRLTAAVGAAGPLDLSTGGRCLAARSVFSSASSIPLIGSWTPCTSESGLRDGRERRSARFHFTGGLYENSLHCIQLLFKVWYWRG